MRYRKLGRSGIDVSEIGIGCLEFGDRVPEADAANIVNAALDAGVNLFDTANGYARGKSEEALGKALKGRRHEAVIATKVRGQGSGGEPGALSRKYLMGAIDSCLNRLGTDYIDLYQVHFPDFDTPIEETMSAFEDLRRAGKIRAYGSSNFPAWYLCDAQWRAKQSGLTGFVSTQIKYNVVSRDVEQDLFPLCRQEGLGVIVYNPLAGSFLAGIYSQDREPAPDSRFGWTGLTDLRAIYKSRYWSDRNFQALEALRSLWSDSDWTMAQQALGWVLHSQTVSSVLVGVASRKELEEDLAAANIAYTPEQLADLDQVWRTVWPVQPYYVIL